MKVSPLAQLGLLNVLPAAAEYVWPSKYDWMEDLMMLQSGLIRHGFIDGVQTCDFHQGGPERQSAAEWIRIAFHDMATFDKETGVGGLDGSIQFESDRPENSGGADFINGTFGFMNGYYTTRSSAADLIALGLVLAVGQCGGPKIPLRVGRIDAKEAGVLGVPEPQQDLDMHKKMFAKAGFSTEDMIAMVACGHTMGGVHGKTFPEITENNTETNVVHFDTTETKFDNKVATEWLDGTTQNPLVVAHNDTLNSDKRIFAADKNVTMKALADAEKFQSMCSNILGRMIDTVPSDVDLSEPIEPITVKPVIGSFSLINATHIKLEGRIRLHTTSERSNDESVVLTYTPHSESSNSNSSRTLNTTIATTPNTWKSGTSVGLFRELFKWYDFGVTLPADTSIKHFNVTVTRVSTGEQTHYDNAGNGFPLDDTVLFQADQSCLTDLTQHTYVAAVRTEVLDAGTPAVARVAKKEFKMGSYVPAIEMVEWTGEKGKVVGDWTLVTFKGELPSDIYLDTDFDLMAGDKGVEFLFTRNLNGECKEF